MHHAICILSDPSGVHPLITMLKRMMGHALSVTLSMVTSAFMVVSAKLRLVMWYSREFRRVC